MITKFDAIVSLRPRCGFELHEDGSINWWNTSFTCPTDAEINAEIERLQADYDAKQYQRDRANEYPSIVDQLDTLYHGGYDAWKAEIEAIKNKYPKGAA